MNASSDIVSETARKSLTLTLQGLSDPGMQGFIAKALQTSEATISRLKSEHLEQVMQMLALLGLKVVKTSDKTINEERLMAVALLAHHSLSSIDDFTNAILGDKD